MIHTSVQGILTNNVIKAPIIENITVKDNQSSKTYDDVINSFTERLTSDSLDGYSNEVLHHLNESLVENSPISMLPNFSISPTGKEEGNFLIIDLGGSTLRVSIILIAGQSKDNETFDDRSNRIKNVIEKKWTIDNSFKVIDKNFFKFIGERIIETINQQDLISVDDAVINTGITWSFPLQQLSHNSGNIVHVGKGFTISDEIYNRDLRLILQSIMKDEFNINVKVKVIINDSLAVYAAGSFLDSNLRLAMVLGTGFNVCCSLDTDDLHPDKRLEQLEVMINSETSLFGSNLIPLSNEFDQGIDERFKPELSFKSHMILDPIKNSIFQPYELMTSGRYLPELTRQSVIKLINEGDIFKNIKLNDKINSTYDGFTSELMCFISESSDIEGIKSFVANEYDLNPSLINDEDCEKLKHLVDAIINRASYLVSISIISFIKLIVSHKKEKISSKKLIVGYVGSILIYFNNYRNLILKYVNENDYIRTLGLEIDFQSIDNSSIVGAAIGAAYYVNRD